MADLLYPLKKPVAVPLPSAKEHEKFFISVPNALSAYHVCLELEQHAMELAKTNTPSESTNRSHPDDPLICARVLGYLLIYAPTSHALAEVVKVIHSCSRGSEADRYSKLLELGASFQNWFIRAFRKFKGRTPQLSDHPSRPSFNVDRKDILENLQEAPKSHADAKKAALYRDGYRCVVTGIYDYSAESFVNVKDITESTSDLVNTECAHIVPESTYFNVKGEGKELKAGYSASVLAVLQRFGYNVENLNGPKVHSLYNVMTMQHDIHDRFDRLLMWFEPTQTTNQYKPTAYSRLHRLPKVVTFTSPDPERFPVPSPELLALHATCCKVAHMSGAAEYLDKYDDDKDHLDVLDPDGSSSGVLHHAIWEKLGKSVDVGA